MRRVLSALLLLVLSLMLAIGCSRQPQPHVGEWESIFYFRGTPIFNIFYIWDNGTVQSIHGYDPGKMEMKEGRYNFDYTKNPIQFDINWKDGSSRFGIIRFLGEEKSSMQWVSADDPQKRPVVFDNKPIQVWTKKVKK